MTASAGDDVRLARLHLRVGMLPLALAELEDLERRTLLDAAARAALAEARWRSGDSDGAAAAARAHLDAGGTDPVVLCIAAEAAAAEGRPAEARSLMDRLGPDAATLDILFAGMPRRAFWPSASAETSEAGTLFAELGQPATVARADAPAGPAGRDRPVAPARAPAPATGSPVGSSPPGPAFVRETAIPGPKQVIQASEGLWKDAPATAGSPSSADRAHRRDVVRAIAQDPVAELRQARAELDADPDRALLRLALTLRLDPTLAPAVLDLVAVRPEPAAALLRGDAQRLLGRHLEAEAAFVSAAASLDEAAAKPRS